MIAADLPAPPDDLAVLRAALGPAPLARIAAVAEAGAALALPLAQEHGAALDLLSLDPRGRLAKEVPGTLVALRDRLVAQGIPAVRLRLVAEDADLLPADLILAPAAWGQAMRIGTIDPVLQAGLAPGGRMLVDVRKGSGAIPHLRPHGTLTALSAWVEGDRPVTRMLFAREGAPPVALPEDDEDAETPAPDPAAEPWSVIARRLAGAEGFYREGGEHAFLFLPRGDTLVVTFDNLDLAMEKRADRRPWGFSFIEKQGWSMLGVTAAGWTWFRDPWVIAEFERLRAEGFFARFARVVFYGASMGGYGAAAFSGACPGADVVAIAPQSTLDRRLVPWETRYQTAWGRDFGGPTGDAAAACAAARRVVLLYDPYERLDRAHADRFSGPNVMRLRAPLMGHRVGSSLQQLGILSAITVAALEGRLTEAEFYRLLRARKTFPRYQRELFDRAVAKGHPTLARRLARWVLVRTNNRPVRRGLAALEARDGG